MIKVKLTKHGLKKGQKFKEMKTDGNLTILKSGKRIAFIETNLITSDLLHDNRAA